MKRGSGILLHVTSLPSRFGIGDLGPWAYRFVDFLAESRQSVWQILPLSPPRPDHYSPYLGPSAFALNPFLISPDLLVDEGLLTDVDLEASPAFPEDQVDYGSVVRNKNRLLDVAFERFEAAENSPDYLDFCHSNSAWLDDFALFRALESRFPGTVWADWPKELRDRHPDALNSVKQELSRQISIVKFRQYIFFKQWSGLKAYCNERGVRLFGDIPIYVDYNSADVWTSPELFKLDEEKRPYVVSGVPPDYFSETGQLWGHPIYRWDALKETGYDWWIRRIEQNLKLCDLARIDHFRGFAGYWEIPAHEKTAINGKWVDGPGRDLFEAIQGRLPRMPIIAEDLGIITPDVTELMEAFDLPGMKVLLFAFGWDLPTNPYAPHNLVKNCVAYTGTHDNNTARGWFEKEAPPDVKQRVLDYLGHVDYSDQIHWDLIRLLMRSVADLVVFPMQDVLGLGADARMNTPSVTNGNWRWRLSPHMLTPELTAKLRSMTEIYGRA
ncbi:4-alpha-glucanotransferase [Thermodesulfobacteriota bacterium]